MIRLYSCGNCVRIFGDVTLFFPPVNTNKAAEQMATSFNFTFKTFNNPADQPFNGLTFNNLMGINNFGLIAGFYGSGQAGDPNQGYLLNRPNQYTAVEFPHVAQTQVTGLNDLGTLVGYLYRTNKGVAVDNQFGFYERDGVFVEVNNPHTPKHPPSGTLKENQLMGVNDSNIAVGFYNDASGNSHGYTYNINNGKFSADINDPKAVSTVTAAINNLGGLVGFYTDAAGVTHGFVDNHGQFATVNAPGADGTELLGVNDFGIASGSKLWEPPCTASSTTNSLTKSPCSTTRKETARRRSTE